MGYFYSDEYLAHHGILGQKWGVRRFENKNGTLTAAGKKRYTTDANGDYQKVKKSLRTKRLEKAANAAQRDADDLRKHGLTEEADAVQKVADKNRAKAEVSANKKGLTDKQKKVIIAGAAIAGTALAAYGGYKMHQAIRNVEDADWVFSDAAPKIDRATVSHTPIDRTPINMDSFNKAAQANDDLVNSLLKKNAKSLGL